MNFYWLVLMLFIGMIGILAFADNDDTKSYESQNSTPFSSIQPPDSQSETMPYYNTPFSLVQDEVRSGTFSDYGNGTYSLSVTGIDKSADYITNYPYPRTINISTSEKDYSSENVNSAKTAVVKLVDPIDPSQESLLVNVSQPVYNSDTETLSYTATPVLNYSGYNLKPFLKDLDESLPSEFGEAMIYYDPDQDSSSICAYKSHSLMCFSNDGKYRFGGTTAPCYEDHYRDTCYFKSDESLAACKKKYGSENGYYIVNDQCRGRLKEDNSSEDYA